MSEQLQKAVRDADLISGGISGLIAAVLLSYVASSSKPGILHLIFAFVGLAAVLAGYLFVARANVEPQWKAGAVIATAVVSVVCFVLLSKLY